MSAKKRRHRRAFETYAAYFVKPKPPLNIFTILVEDAVSRAHARSRRARTRQHAHHLAALREHDSEVRQAARLCVQGDDDLASVEHFLFPLLDLLEDFLSSQKSTELSG